MFKPTGSHLFVPGFSSNADIAPQGLSHRTWPTCSQRGIIAAGAPGTTVGGTSEEPCLAFIEVDGHSWRQRVAGDAAFTLAPFRMVSVLRHCLSSFSPWLLLVIVSFTLLCRVLVLFGQTWSLCD